MEVLSRWKQVPLDRRVFVGVVLGFPLLMGGLFFAAGGQGYFGTGLQVGGFISATILAVAALGWILTFGAQVIFGAGRAEHELLPGQILARSMAARVGSALQVAVDLAGVLFWFVSSIAIYAYFESMGFVESVFLGGALAHLVFSKDSKG